MCVPDCYELELYVICVYFHKYTEGLWTNHGPFLSNVLAQADKKEEDDKEDKASMRVCQFRAPIGPICFDVAIEPTTNWWTKKTADFRRRLMVEFFGDGSRRG